MQTPTRTPSSYSATLANDPSRRKARTTFGPYCLLSLAPSSKGLDTALGCVSVLSYAGCSVVLVGGMLSLLPSMLISKYLLQWPSMVNPPTSSSTNNSNNNTLSTLPSLTAIKTLSARSQMALQGSGGPDSLAPLFMAHVSLLGPNIHGSLFFTKFYLFCQRLHFYATGRIFADQMAYFGRKKLAIPFGETTFLQVRTCWLDDCLERFLGNHKKANVVILGAGYDSRCYRFQQQQQQQHRQAGSADDAIVHWFEIDARGPQAAKLEALQNAGVSSSAAAGVTTYVPCDFESQDWLEALLNYNFDKNVATFFVWEGVTPYLNRNVVIQTIQNVASCGVGSMIGFDYFDKALLDQTMVKAAAKVTSERWTFALDNAEVWDLVKECNKKKTNRNKGHELVILDHLKADELVQRYCAKHSDGRTVGYLEDFGGLLLIGST